MEKYEGMLTRKAAADLLEVSTKTLSNYVRKGLIHSISRGGKNFFDRKEVIALKRLKGSRVVSVSPVNSEALNLKIVEMLTKLDNKLSTILDLVSFQKVSASSSNGLIKASTKKPSYLID